MSSRLTKVLLFIVSLNRSRCFFIVFKNSAGGEENPLAGEDMKTFTAWKIRPCQVKISWINASYCFFGSLTTPHSKMLPSRIADSSYAGHDRG
jgi:hypothetical protein